jgi:DNA-binding SARP family transcriptional activator
MEAFWPGSDPEAARNNLNVALHGLRESLRIVTDRPIIIYELGNYCLESDVEMWIDLEEFEQYSLEGNRLEAAGQLERAVRSYEAAINLYQGGFLEEDPYEEWTILPRERLRFAYLDLLSRLSNIKFDKGEYSACVGLCQRILDCDNCREESHQRLMVCYSRQGQASLALRQYQVCIEALHANLDVEPETATTQLVERIRRHERV